MLAQDTSSGVPSREETFDAIERVLARPEFQPEEVSALTHALREIQESIADLRTWILERLGSLIGGGDGAAKVVITVLVVATLVLLVYAIWSVMKTYRVDEPGGDGKRQQAQSTLAEDPSEELSRAGALAAGGSYAEAMHALYRGVLLWLDEIGHARFEEGKTGGDYARELRNATLRRPFRGLLSAFYPVAFGGRDASAKAWDSMRQAATGLGVPE